MCGLSLILDPAAPPTLGGRLRRMHAPIRHRGPDGEGFLGLRADGSVARGDSAGALDGAGHGAGLAFRRLRILDLSEAAAQPMASPDRRRWIVFNGEVYNFRALRGELAARGREFRTHRRHGGGAGRVRGVGRALLRAAGRDVGAGHRGPRAGRGLVLSRDRFGIKPLHWALERRRAAGGVGGEAGAGRAGGAPAGERAAGRRVPGRHALPLPGGDVLRGRAPVPPATWCEVPLAGPVQAPRFQPYWSLADFHAPAGTAEPGYAAALERFGGLLRDAVSSHTVADVRAGSLLSGGLDSSAVTALLGPAARAEGREWPTFSFGVRGAEARLDELPYAEAVARAHGLENHQAGMDAAWVRDQRGGGDPGAGRAAAGAARAGAVPDVPALPRARRHRRAGRTGRRRGAGRLPVPPAPAAAGPAAPRALAATRAARWGPSAAASA